MDRRALLFLVALALFLAPTAAAGLAPDPTWVSGVWDDGDSDAVAILWENTAAIVPALTVPLTPAARRLTGPPPPTKLVSEPRPRSVSRAPPLV